MSSLLLTGIRQLVTNDSTDSDLLGVISEAAVAVVDGTVAWVGPEADLPSDHAGLARVDCEGRAVIPGFVDAHTHLVFAGDRSDEFAGYDDLIGQYYEDEFLPRLNIHRDEKAVIAEKALEIIENGDTIFLDASSTCAMIAEYLYKSRKELTVITNMLEIVRILEPNNDIRCILVGGLYNRMIGGFVGIETIELINGYHVDKAFISCMSVRLKERRLYSSTKDIGFTKTAILNQSKVKVLVTETRKFEYHGTVKFYELEDLDYMICERDLSKEEEDSIEELSINII